MVVVVVGQMIDIFDLYEWGRSGMVEAPPKNIASVDTSQGLYIKFLDTLEMRSAYFNAGIQYKANDYQIAKESMLDRHNAERGRLENEVRQLKNEVTDLRSYLNNVADLQG